MIWKKKIESKWPLPPENPIWHQKIIFAYKSEGTDERGVPKIRGRWNAGSAIFCALMIYAGVCILFSPRSHSSTVPLPTLNTIWFYNIVCGVCCVCLPVKAISIRRKIKKLTDARSISSRFGIDAEALTNFAKKQGIKPRYNINGEDFYDLKDFGDAATLLRASVAPAAESETLLRPAASGNVTPAEHLLRPSDSLDAETNRQTAIRRNGR